MLSPREIDPSSPPKRTHPGCSVNVLRAAGNRLLAEMFYTFTIVKHRRSLQRTQVAISTHGFNHRFLCSACGTKRWQEAENVVRAKPRGEEWAHTCSWACPLTYHCSLTRGYERQKREQRRSSIQKERTVLVGVSPSIVGEIVCAS